MQILVVGASSGLGRAMVERLLADEHTVTGISRRRPTGISAPWIEADISAPAQAAATIHAAAPVTLDLLIWNLGVWEPSAFSESYRFTEEADEISENLIATNVTGPILTIRALLPRLLEAPVPRIILTGSTSGLPRSGRPEVAFGASKSALNGIADALREGYRDRGLQVSVLQLGDLNTDDGLDVPREEAARRGGGALAPVHDVVEVLRTMINLSPSSFVREIVMPAAADPRF